MFLLKLASGLALITFGVRFLRKGLDRLFGGRLLFFLERASSNRAKALCAGMVTGAAAPSSTGLSLLIAQILGSGRIGTDRLLSILLGANIGMTVLANVAALELGDYAGLLLFFGVIGFQFLRKERVRGIGQCLLALGFIFLAMDFLKDGAKTFGNSQDVDAIFAVLDRHPIILCIAAAGLAVLLQSSTATVGLGIGLAAGGVLPDSLFWIWIVGTNLGLGLTSLLVSSGSLEGKRLGVANLVAKLAVSALIIGLLPLTNSATKVSMPVGQRLALMHTAFNLLVAVISLPFVTWLLTVVRKVLVPNRPQGEVQGSFLDAQALESASIALAHATRESLRMTDTVRNMFQNLWTAYLQRDTAGIKSARAQDDAVDEMHRELILFLSQIGDLSDFDRKWHSILMSYTSELEAVGDILEKNLSATMLRQVADGISLSSDDMGILTKLYEKTILRFDLMIGLVTTREPATAERILNATDELDAWCSDEKKLHYMRLKSADKQALSTSLCFLDILDGLRRVSDHLSTIAMAFKSESRRARKARAKMPPKAPDPAVGLGSQTPPRNSATPEIDPVYADKKRVPGESD